MNEVNKMNENSKLTDAITIDTKRVASVRGVLKRHKMMTFFITISGLTLGLSIISNTIGLNDKYEGLNIVSTVSMYTLFISLFIFVLFLSDGEIKHTLSGDKIAYLNDVLIFPSEPHTLYRRHYFINPNGTDSERINLTYPEKPLRVVKLNHPKNAEEREMLRMTQIEEKSVDDILELHEVIVSSKQAIQDYEDSKIHQRVREQYQIHQSASQENEGSNPALDDLMKKFEQVDDEIKSEIQQKLNDNYHVLKAGREK